jgi:TolA-binding protein
MKLARSLSAALSLALVTGAATTWAAQPDPHKPHHSAGTASAAAVKAMPGKPSLQIAQMDTQMKAMDAVHEKMLAAKTPEERNALMSEHTQIMQDGMTMMNGMTARGMGGMKGDMAAHHQMMEKRMEMMQTTMRMMMDRLPQSPAKP